jgi:hypothetical protein
MSGTPTNHSNGSGNNKLWNQLKGHGKKVQLQGEIQWLKRQITCRQKKFGVEFYDLVTNSKQSLLGISSQEHGEDDDVDAANGSTNPPSFLSNLFSDCGPDVLTWKEPLEQLHDSLRTVQDKHDRLEQKCQSLFNFQNHNLDDGGMGMSSPSSASSVDGGGQSKNALDKIKVAAQRKKLQAQLLVLEQQIKLKKEKFGVAIFSGLEMSKDLSKLSTQEQIVQECIDVALADVHQLQAQINVKYALVHNLHEGETEGLMTKMNTNDAGADGHDDGDGDDDNAPL